MRKCPRSLAVLGRPLSGMFDIFPSKKPEIERKESVLINEKEFKEMKKLHY